MSDYGFIFRYELKKIIVNRVAIISLIGCICLLLGIVMFENIVISPEDRNVYEKEKFLEGVALDDEILSEISREAVAAGGIAKISTDSRYYHVSKYVYRAIGGYMNFDDISGDFTGEDLSEGSFYQTRERIMDYLYDYFCLDEAERAYWDLQEAKIKKPFTWHTNQGIEAMKSSIDTALVISCMVMGVCLAGVYAGEKAHRTDALILCTREGKKSLWLIKLAAGETFALLAGTLLLIAVELPSLIFNGLHGLECGWQILVPFSSYAYSAGHMLLVYFGLYYLVCLLTGALVMLVSVMLRSMVAVAGIISAFVMLDLFIAIPAKFGMLSQIRYLTPVQVMTNSSMSDLRLLKLGGHSLTSLQSAGILYAALTVLLWLAVGRIYKCGRS